MGNAHVRALANTLCVMSPNNCLQCATQSRECRDETRVSLSLNRRVPAANVSGRWAERRSAHQTCPKSHNRTTRQFCRGRLRSNCRCHDDAWQCGCVAISVQRAGPDRHFADRWQSGHGLCGKSGHSIVSERKFDGRRLTIRRCLLAGDDPCAVTRACAAQNRSGLHLPAVAESVR